MSIPTCCSVGSSQPVLLTLREIFLGVDAGTWSPCPAVPWRQQPPLPSHLRQGPRGGEVWTLGPGQQPGSFLYLPPSGPRSGAPGAACPAPVQFSTSFFELANPFELFFTFQVLPFCHKCVSQCLPHIWTLVAIP